MNDTISVAGASDTRRNILDHLDLVERVIRRMGLACHHQVDEYRSAGFFAFAHLAAPGLRIEVSDVLARLVDLGRDDGNRELRSYLAACVRNEIRNVRRKLGMSHRRFVQEDPEIPLDLALASREIAPDRMAMLREEHDLDNLVLRPPVLPRTGHRLTPTHKQTIRRVIDENPTWGLTKLTRRARELTGVAIARSTIRSVRLKYLAASADRERSMDRAMTQPRPNHQPARCKIA